MYYYIPLYIHTHVQVYSGGGGETLHIYLTRKDPLVISGIHIQNNFKLQNLLIMCISQYLLPTIKLIKYTDIQLVFKYILKFVYRDQNILKTIIGL